MSLLMLDLVQVAPQLRDEEYSSVTPHFICAISVICCVNAPLFLLQGSNATGWTALSRVACAFAVWGQPDEKEWTLQNVDPG